jgi:hypothetical protein
MQKRQDQRGPHNDATPEPAGASQASQDVSTQLEVNVLATPAPILDLDSLTDVELQRMFKNITMIRESTSRFVEILETKVSRPLDACLEITKDDVLSWEQCIQIFEVRRGLDDAVRQLSQSLEVWTREGRSPLFSLYIAEIEKYATLLCHHETGVLRLIELSTEAGWALQVQNALKGVSDARSITEEVLEWLTQADKEARDELVKRGAATQATILSREPPTCQ